MIKLKDLLLKENNQGEYLIHATSSKYRDSILQHGLIPKDIRESPHFTKVDKEYFHYENPAIFATKIGSNVDVYDIANIKNKVYLVPAATFDNYKNFKSIAMKKIRFYERMRAIEKESDKRIIGMEIYELEKDYNNELNNLMQHHGNYDIWLIDNDIANVQWHADEFGIEGDLVIDYSDAGSVLTYDKIPPKALELIVASGRNVKFGRWSNK